MAQKVSDRIVRPRTVLDCVLRLQHHGITPAMLHLEQTEPDLAEYLLETLTAIHQGLLDLHAPAAKSRKVYRQVKLMALVCVEAYAEAMAEQWQQIDGSTGDIDSGSPNERPNG